MPERVCGAVVAEPWAITSDYLHAVWALASRQPALSPLTADGRWEPRALEVYAGPATTRLAGARYALQSEGVAILPVIGPLFPRANMMTEMSGATSVAQLDQDLALAVASSQVDAILLLIDSPGGRTSGIAAFAERVYQARARKPIVAHVAGTGASAAYWIAAATREITLDRTAMVGSIGVIAGIPRQVEPDQNGVMTIEVVSSNAPRKSPDPESEEGRAALVQLLDALEAEFIADVARGRGVGVGVVREEFGRGGQLVGKRAVEARMADGIQSYEATLAALKREARTRARARALAG